MSTFAKRLRKGFTLIELLVVIAIIAILIALLVPAVQKVRAAAARSQCTNNLKQLALGCQNYADSYKRFPPGALGGVGGEAAGWSALILPYLDQQPLYAQLGLPTPLAATPRGIPTSGSLQTLYGGTAPGPATITQTVLSVYVCPSDFSGVNSLVPGYATFPGGAIVNGTFAGTYNTANVTPAKSNYLGVCGTANCGNATNDGILYLNSTTTFDDITDGTSNTFLIGEVCSYYGAGTWVGNRNPGGTGDEGTNYTLRSTSQQLNVTPSTTNTLYGFGSLHTGGANFAFADGSVHFISSGIPFNAGAWAGGNVTTAVSSVTYTGFGAYNLLGSKADGQTVDTSLFQ
jgi:prepilin-type N-terminal cleavage/methylation domain-containing protein/prepilin-type processing-associated H-X9-DG protein